MWRGGSYEFEAVLLVVTLVYFAVAVVVFVAVVFVAAVVVVVNFVAVLLHLPV